MVGGESLEIEAFLHKVDGGGSLNHRGPTPNLILLIPSGNRGMSGPMLTINVGNMRRWDTLKGTIHAKRQGAVSGRECMNSPTAQRHSPTITKATNIGGKKMASNNTPSKFLNPDHWTRLIGMANEEKITLNGNTVTALLDTGSQMPHVSLDYCQAMGIPIHLIEQMVNIEGAGGCHRICWLHRSRLIFSYGNPCAQD